MINPSHGLSRREVALLHTLPSTVPNNTHSTVTRGGHTHFGHTVTGHTLSGTTVSAVSRGRHQFGQTKSGQIVSSSAHTVSGHTVSEVSRRGHTHFGQTLSGQTISGYTVSAVSRGGHTQFGQTKSGHTVSAVCRGRNQFGHTKSGHTLTGHTGTGDTVSGHTKSGQTVSSPGHTLSGHTVSAVSGGHNRFGHTESGHTFSSSGRTLLGGTHSGGTTSSGRTKSGYTLSGGTSSEGTESRGATVSESRSPIDRGTPVHNGSLSRNHIHTGVPGKVTTQNMAISNFHISFKGETTNYKPGDELCGTVIMDVWATVDIKYIEFIITGKGTLRTFKVKNKFQEPTRYEVYLEKKIVLIGPSTGSHGVKVTRSGVTLTPGRYVSHFKYLLPMELPPSVHQFDLGDGYVFDISYSVSAHVCDNLRSRYLPHAPQLIRVVKATKRNFLVTSYYDWQSLPNALEPISHSEQVKLYCAPRSGPTTIMMQLERSVYPLGDAINLHVEILTQNLRRIKEVRAELEQTLLLPWKHVQRFTHILIKAYDNYKNRDKRKLQQNIARSSFAIQIPSRLVPSYLPHCHLVGVSYHIKISVIFKGLSGIMVMRIPIIIAPESHELRLYADPDIPLFKRPAVYPAYFTRSTNHSSDGPSNNSTDNSLSRLALRGMASDRSTRYNPISSKYVTCSDCCVGCFGFGLYE